MKREILMLGGLLGMVGAMAAPVTDVLVEDGATSKRVQRSPKQARPLSSSKPERKEKSASLRRMLKNKKRI